MSAKDERKAQIVSAAARLFGEHGYSGVSMADVADEVGLSKSSVYHYFLSKAEILSCIHDEFVGPLYAAQSERIASPGPTAASDLQAVIRETLEMMQSYRHNAKLFFEVFDLLEDTVRKELRIRRDWYFASVESIIRRGIMAGEFRPTNPRVATFALFGMINWTYRWYRPDGALSPEEISTEFFKLFMDGLSAQDGADHNSVGTYHPERTTLGRNS